MKKVSLLFLIGMLLTSVTFTSCDKVADELQNSVEVTINTDLEAAFVATPTEVKASTDGNYEFKEVVILDPSRSDDLSDYLDKIQSVEITGITIRVTSISNPNIVLNSAVFTLVDNIDGSKFEYNTPANSAIVVGSTFAIGESNAGWDTINKIIGDMHASTITAEGSINQDNFEVGFVYVISIKATATPLS